MVSFFILSYLHTLWNDTASFIDSLKYSSEKIQNFEKEKKNEKSESECLIPDRQQIEFSSSREIQETTTTKIVINTTKKKQPRQSNCNRSLGSWQKKRKRERENNKFGGSHDIWQRNIRARFLIN